MVIFLTLRLKPDIVAVSLDLRGFYEFLSGHRVVAEDFCDFTQMSKVPSPVTSASLKETSVDCFKSKGGRWSPMDFAAGTSNGDIPVSKSLNKSFFFGFSALALAMRRNAWCQLPKSVEFTNTL